MVKIIIKITNNTNLNYFKKNQYHIRSFIIEYHQEFITSHSRHEENFQPFIYIKNFMQDLNYILTIIYSHYILFNNLIEC